MNELNQEVMNLNFKFDLEIDQAILEIISQGISESDLEELKKELILPDLLFALL